MTTQGSNLARATLSAASRLRFPRQRNVNLTKVLIVASFLTVGGMFSARGIIGAPVTSAAAPQGIDVDHIARTVPGDLGSFEDSYQRYYGVLDAFHRE